jgi:hypothetical protein
LGRKPPSRSTPTAFPASACPRPSRVRSAGQADLPVSELEALPARGVPTA